MSEEKIVITLDGTSGSGKSTNSKIVADKLGYFYVDTGAMYRTFAWWCLKSGIDVKSPEKLETEIERWPVELQEIDRKLWLAVDGYFPENEIRSSEVSAVVSLVATNPIVRKWMKETQRSCIEFGSLVMEGRDIGSNIFPESPYKFYIDARLEERTARREAEGVVENLAARDKQDSERKTNPLVIPDGAIIVNTSGKTPDETSAIILENIQKISKTKS